MADAEHLFSIALGELIHLLNTDLLRDTWLSLNCGEASSLADVLELGGQVIGDPVGGRHAARMVVGQHAADDEPGDAHYYPVGRRVKYVSPGLRFGRVGVVTEPIDLVGIVSVQWDREGESEPVHIADLEPVP